MNQLRAFLTGHAPGRGGPADKAISYRPVHVALADRLRTPAKVTGAVMGAAALAYVALTKKRRGPSVKPVPPLSPREAAHKLAAKPVLGAPQVPANTPVLAGQSAKKRHAFGKPARSAKKPSPQQGSWRQIVMTGRSLITLANAFSAFKAAQHHVESPPVPDTTAAATETLPVKPDAPASAPATPAFKPVPPGSLLTRSWHLIKAAVSSWVDDFAPSMGAALSYYTVFSLAPMLLIVIGVAGLVFGADAARGEIVTQLRGLMGEQGAVAVEELLKSASDPGQGILATIIGFATLMVGATAVFAELQSSLDRIWRTPAPINENGIWGMIRTRFLSFGLILGLGFLMIVSLVLSAALAALGNWWGSYLGNWEFVLQALNFIFSFAVVTVMFAAIYKFMPHAKIEWPNVWVGAVVTALLFTIGKFLISLYIGKSGVASGFGAAGSFAVLLVWVYYSAQIFLLGAEFTWVYSHRNAPPPDAAPVPVRSDPPPAAPAVS